MWRGGSNVRSAELVWVAQPIACCGEVGGVGRRGEIAQRRVRTPLIVIADPVRDRCPRMSEAEEEGFVKKLIPHPAIKTLAEAVLHGLARRVKCQVILFSCAQASTAFDVNSVSLSETIILGSPCRSINEVRSRATRRPEMEVSGIAAMDSAAGRHARACDKSMLSMRSRAFAHPAAAQSRSARFSR